MDGCCRFCRDKIVDPRCFSSSAVILVALNKDLWTASSCDVYLRATAVGFVTFFAGFNGCKLEGFQTLFTRDHLKKEMGTAACSFSELKIYASEHYTTVYTHNIMFKLTTSVIEVLGFFILDMISSTLLHRVIVDLYSDYS